mmetsp:Transcript_13384/g.16138  ORF Transcript_13384/g.16138 Transcript_13384/m.16138 type:complete len:258 (-) Transcript_13384:2-775(-)
MLDTIVSEIRSVLQRLWEWIRVLLGINLVLGKSESPPHNRNNFGTQNRGVTLKAQDGRPESALELNAKTHDLSESSSERAQELSWSAHPETGSEEGGGGMKGRVLNLFAAPEGGVPKPEVRELEVTESGCIGDLQRNLKYHGGPNRAVCLFNQSVIARLREEGHPIFGGSCGENILLSQSIDWKRIEIGCLLRFKHVVLEITEPTKPCRTIQDCFLNKDFKQLCVKRHPDSPRWYAKVLTPGVVRVGEDVTLLKPRT